MPSVNFKVRPFSEQSLEVLSLLDFTQLSFDESDMLPFLENASSLPIAAICIQATFIQLAKQHINCPIATVVNFPQGNRALDAIINEIKFATDEGADEIDLVFPYSLYMTEPKTALNNTESLLKVIEDRITTKVIIETGVYDNQQTIQTLCHDLCLMPINFIKTSTGKIAKGADIDSVKTILHCVKGTSLGIKVSGGVNTPAEAMTYINLAKDILKLNELTPKRFRIGASQLVNQLN